MDKIKIDYLSHPSIGFNQSGMRTQIDTLFDFFEKSDLVNVEMYDIWENNNPNIIHYFGMGEGMLSVLQNHKHNGAKIICSPNHWPLRSRVDRFLMNFNFKNVIYTNRATKSFLIKASDLFIVNSIAEKEKFTSTYKIDEKRIKVIHNSYGLEPVLIKEDLFGEKYNINYPYALMAGHLGSKRKNQLPVIKCWKSTYPDLYILGGYSPTAYGKECMKLVNEKNNVHFLGFESNHNILESAYQNCELFISPGLIETPSLSAFRALINGAKVCSTNFGGAPNEYFDNNVKYFNPFDENEIANTIDLCFSVDKWDINHIDLKRFSNESICHEYGKTYLNLF